MNTKTRTEHPFPSKQNTCQHKADQPTEQKPLLPGNNDFSAPPAWCGPRMFKSTWMKIKESSVKLPATVHGAADQNPKSKTKVLLGGLGSWQIIPWGFAV